MISSNVLKPRSERRLDADRLMAAIRNLETCQPLVPHDHRDREFFAPCLKRRRTSKVGGRLTDEDILAIRRRYATESITQAQLADLYQISRVTVWKIVHHIHHAAASQEPTA